MRPRILVAVLLLMATLGAMFSAAQIPASDIPTSLEESECYTCHKDGGGSLGPPLPVLYLIHSPGNELSFEPDESVLFEVGVENAWTALLKDIVGIADLTNAPAFGFSTGRDPLTNITNGVVDPNPSIATNPEIDQRATRLSVPFPAGASDIVLTLEADPTAQTRGPPTDWAMHLWPPAKDPDNEAPIIVDNQTTDIAEVFELHGVDEIAKAGIGDWTVDVVVTGDQTGAGTHPFQLTVFTDFKSTGERRAFTGTSEELPSRVEEPGRLAYMGWNLVMAEIPTEPQVISVEVILIGHFDHGSTQISSYDDWRFTKTIDVTILPEDGGARVESLDLDGGNVAVPVKAAFAWDSFSEIIGYVSAVLIIASIYTGGMFGKASRRQLNAVFGTAKRRVAFHNFLSYGILLAAAIHTVIFLVESIYDWTLGIIWGSLAIIGMIGLGLTGALQVPMIRKWNYAVWRWSHFYLSIGTIVFTIVHILLDGVHFVELQDKIGWANPFTKDAM